MIDVTVPISPRMTSYPGDPPVDISSASRIARGDPANVSRYCFGSHTGTHVDPPCHFVPGAATIDQIPLDKLVGVAHVLSVEHILSAITAADLAAASIPSATVRLLLKTRNSARWENPESAFAEDYVHLAPDAARWLVERGIRLVGIDYLSIEGFHSPGHPVHHILLSNGVVVVEGLDLRQARPGDYRFVCLPLRVKGGDGGPARAFLL